MLSHQVFVFPAWQFEFRFTAKLRIDRNVCDCENYHLKVSKHTQMIDVRVPWRNPRHLFWNFLKNLCMSTWMLTFLSGNFCGNCSKIFILGRNEWMNFIFKLWVDLFFPTAFKWIFFGLCRINKWFSFLFEIIIVFRNTKVYEMYGIWKRYLKESLTKY